MESTEKPPEQEPSLVDLAHQRARLSAIIRGTNVGTWEWNLLSGELLLNARWAEIIGYTLEELSPTSIDTWTKYAHPDDLERSARLLEQHFRGEIVHYELETRMRHKNGEWIWVLDRGQVAKWTADGKPELMVGSHEDITARKKTEADLYHRVAFEKLLLSTFSAFLSADAASIDPLITGALRDIGEFAQVDRAYVFRFGPELATMSNTHEWCAPGISPEMDNLKDVPTSFFPSWMAALRAGTPVYIPDIAALPESWAPEREVLEPQGIKSLVVLPVVVGSRLLGYVGFDSVRAPRTWEAVDQSLLRFFVDNLGLTLVREEQHQALRLATEAAERHAAEKDQANRAKSEFLANMSHEIRTPMNAITGFAQVLARDPLLAPRQVEHVHAIVRNGGHLLRLINDILDMSKIEAGQTRLNLSSFSLPHFLDEIELMFRAHAVSKGLHFTVERGEGVVDSVTGDEGKLRQVLVNLLGNAIKFTQSGSVTLRVRTEVFPDPAAPLQTMLRLQADIEDTGPGISDEDASKLFVPFQQASGTTRSGGTGLGLAISRKFVEIMGGHLTLTSQVDKGSCFTFDVLLPQVDAPTDRTRRRSREILGLVPGTPGQRVLVVDDVADSRALLSQLLGGVGFEVREARDGAEALEIFHEWAPHAVLMDMWMAVMDGYEATRRLKATAVGRATPVIAVSAGAFADDEAKAKAAGVDAFVRKPFSPEDILDQLGTRLDLRYVLGDEIGTFPPGLRATEFTGATLGGLPPAMLRAMRSAVADGDMASLVALIEAAEGYDRSVAQALRTLADLYDYDKLEHWLSQGST